MGRFSPAPIGHADRNARHARLGSDIWLAAPPRPKPLLFIVNGWGCYRFFWCSGEFCALGRVGKPQKPILEDFRASGGRQQRPRRWSFGRIFFLCGGNCVREFAFEFQPLAQRLLAVTIWTNSNAVFQNVIRAALVQRFDVVKFIASCEHSLAVSAVPQLPGRNLALLAARPTSSWWHAEGCRRLAWECAGCGCGNVAF